MAKPSQHNDLCGTFPSDCCQKRGRVTFIACLRIVVLIYEMNGTLYESFSKDTSLLFKHFEIIEWLDDQYIMYTREIRIVYVTSIRTNLKSYVGKRH